MHLGKAPGTLPIVFTVDADPVGRGLVASLARPGGSVTGLSDSHADLVPKRLELLKEVVPSVVRVGVLLNPGRPHRRAPIEDRPGRGASVGPDGSPSGGQRTWT
jgi:ABC-type uncharacterized transport system substrate-binding protein